MARLCCHTFFTSSVISSLFSNLQIFKFFPLFWIVIVSAVYNDKYSPLIFEFLGFYFLFYILYFFASSRFLLEIDEGQLIVMAKTSATWRQEADVPGFRFSPTAGVLKQQSKLSHCNGFVDFVKRIWDVFWATTMLLLICTDRNKCQQSLKTNTR